MTAAGALLAAQPGWGWLALGPALLAAELLTGSGYLLWPAASAAVVAGLLLLGAPLGGPGAMAVFAALTVASTLAARRWLPRRSRDEAPRHDLNDMARRLLGREGRATAEGRVFVDGQEWAAEWDGAAPAPAGAAVRVLAVLGGARLRVAAVLGCDAAL